MLILINIHIIFTVVIFVFMFTGLPGSLPAIASDSSPVQESAQLHEEHSEAQVPRSLRSGEGH